MFNMAMLIDGEVVETYDLAVWAEWTQKADSAVAQENVGSYYVSTIFLGINTSIGTPLWFETMVFSSDSKTLEQERCSTLEQAKEQHQLMVLKYKDE